jgi:hypothetical protein
MGGQMTRISQRAVIQKKGRPVTSLRFTSQSAAKIVQLRKKCLAGEVSISQEKDD